MTTQGNKYNVIIDSVGTASPVISRVLSEGLNLPVEMVSKAIYNAPAILFNSVDEKLADNAKALLTQLGLDVSVTDATVSVPPPGESVEVAVYLEDITKLPLVCKQLSEFLGCETKEALALLVNEPGIVIGNISMATANALGKRLDAEITISNPANELYTLEFNTQDRFAILQMNDYFKNHSIEADINKQASVENISYSMAQDFWKRYQHYKAVNIVNQGFRRYELLLESITRPGREDKQMLSQLSGMPLSIVDEVLVNLPVQLHESFSGKEAEEKLKQYAEAGFNCKLSQVSSQPCKLSIRTMTRLENVNSVLSAYFEKAELPVNTGLWTSPKPMKRGLTRYLAAQLEAIGCEVEIQ